MKSPSPFLICVFGFSGLIACIIQALEGRVSLTVTLTTLLVTGIAVAGLWVLRSAYRLSRESKTWLSPGTVFLCFIAIHFATSYWAATVIYELVMPGDTNGFRNLLACFDIYLLSLLSVCVGFIWEARQRHGLGRQADLVTHRMAFLARVDTATVVRVAIAIGLIGSCVCFYVYRAVGVIPILSNDPGSRYFGPEYTSRSVLYNSLFRRGVVLLTVASPILILGWLKDRKSVWIFLSAALALITMVASTRRGPLIFALICVFFVYALFGLRVRVLLAGVATSLAIILVLQFAVLGGLSRTGPNSIAMDAAITYGEVFGEVREFAWLLSEWDRSYLHGRTLEAALLPLPETASAFKTRNLLSSVTKNIVGIPEDAPHGGLRILIFGEAFLNFGYAGVIFVGVLFGVALAISDRFFWEIRRKARPLGLTTISVLPFVYLYAVLCYEIYFGGSVSLADSLLGIAILFLVYAAGLPRLRNTHTIKPVARQTRPSPMT